MNSESQTNTPRRQDRMKNLLISTLFATLLMQTSVASSVAKETLECSSKTDIQEIRKSFWNQFPSVSYLKELSLHPDISDPDFHTLSASPEKVGSFFQYIATHPNIKGEALKSARATLFIYVPHIEQAVSDDAYKLSKKFPDGKCVTEFTFNSGRTREDGAFIGYEFSFKKLAGKVRLTNINYNSDDQ